MFDEVKAKHAPQSEQAAEVWYEMNEGCANVEVNP